MSEVYAAKRSVTGPGFSRPGEFVVTYDLDEPDERSNILIAQNSEM